MKYKINSTNNCIIADQEFMDLVYPNDYTKLPEDIIEPAPTNKYISVGAFFDRFGPLKWAILADTNPSVQALIKDCTVRKHIDLNREDLPLGLSILTAAGHSINPTQILESIILDSERP